MSSFRPRAGVGHPTDREGRRAKAALPSGPDGQLVSVQGRGRRAEEAPEGLGESAPRTGRKEVHSFSLRDEQPSGGAAGGFTCFKYKSWFP